MGPWIRHLRLAVSQPQPLNARKPRGGWRDWLRLVPEVALLLGAMVLADAFLFGGHRFADWALHPFWLPVLLAAAQYGLSGGAFAALAATLALYLGALPDKGADQDYYEYVGALALQPAAWFATATLLGALRNLQAHTENQLRRALAGAEDRLEAVTDGMDRAVSEIERLERRLASDTATVNRILENFARVELATPQSFSDSMARLVADTLDVTLFAVYLRSARGFELATVFDEDGDSPRMEPSATLFEALIAGGGQAITRETASASALPLGATIAVPLLAPDGQHVTGAVVLERFRTPPQNLAATAARAALIGRVLGTLLEATGETGGHRAASVERLRAAVFAAACAALALLAAQVVGAIAYNLGLIGVGLVLALRGGVCITALLLALRFKGAGRGFLVTSAIWVGIGGAFGAGVAALVILLGRRRKKPEPFGKWVDGQLGFEETARAEGWRARVLDDRVRIEGASEVQSLCDILAGDDQRAKLRAMSVVVRNYDASFSTPLQIALKDEDAALRVMAASALAKLQKDFSDRQSAASAAVDRAPVDLNAWIALAQSHLAFAASGLLSMERRREEREKARQVLRRAYAYAPPQEDQARLEFARLLIDNQVYVEAIDLLAAPFANDIATARAANLRSEASTWRSAASGRASAQRETTT